MNNSIICFKKSQRVLYVRFDKKARGRFITLNDMINTPMNITQYEDEKRVKTKKSEVQKREKETILCQSTAQKNKSKDFKRKQIKMDWD